MADQAPAFPVMTIAQANALLTAPGARFEMEEKAHQRSEAAHLQERAADASRHHAQFDQLGRARIPRLPGRARDLRRPLQGRRASGASKLRDDFGVKKGDRVAVIMRNYPQWSVGFFAALVIGAIATPMNSWWTGEELEYGLSDSGAKVAIVDPREARAHPRAPAEAVRAAARARGARHGRGGRLRGSSRSTS